MGVLLKEMGKGLGVSNMLQVRVAQLCLGVFARVRQVRVAWLCICVSVRLPGSGSLGAWG
jgi:hypothetical protein